MNTSWTQKALRLLLTGVLTFTGSVVLPPHHAATAFAAEAQVESAVEAVQADQGVNLKPDAAAAPQSEIAPLTVAEAVAAGSTGNTARVEGYVVGHATGSKTANFTPPFGNNFNLLLADQPAETDASKLLNVQIPTALRDQFGLSSHPELIGQKVDVTGLLQNYNNFAGLKGVTSIVLGKGGGGTPDPGTGTGQPGTEPEGPNPGTGTGGSEPGNPDPGQTPDLPDGHGKKVLFDNSHAQTAGAADWVIDGAFSDFAEGLRADGFAVDSLERTAPYTFGEQAITYDKLKDYDVFVIAEANVPFKQSEQDALLQYVQNGGGVFFISDHYNADRNKNRWDASEVFNGYRRGALADPAKGMNAEEAASPAMQGLRSSDWLADNFGVRFRYNAIGDVNATDVVGASQSFGITEGVQSVAVHAGSTVAILDPSKAKGIVYVPQNPPAWGNAVDSGVYSGGGRAEGPYVAIAKNGLGKAAFIGDSSPVEDATPKYLREENGQTKKTYDGFKEVDDAKLLVQAVEWLAHKESYTSLNEVPGLIKDTPTALLPSEEPAASTEPQAEPWAAPAAGYKWYDPSTFKPGSYGSTKKPDPKPVYSFVHQKQLPAVDEFQIRLVADGLTPGQTLSDLKVSIYLAGGTQVARFKGTDGSWSDYGYSPVFSMTANASGHAAQELTVQLKPGTLGAASLRLRQGSTNLITNPVEVAAVPAEPLPGDHPPVPAAIPVSAARAVGDGTLVTVEGVITSEPGVFGGQGFYLQDGTAGIYVYQTEAGYHAGDKISISASKTVYNGEVELENPVVIEKKGTASLPQPTSQTELNEANQGQLVTLQNVEIRGVKAASPAGSFEFDVASSSGSTTHVRIDGRTGLTMSEFTAKYPEGARVNLTGISAIFKGTYQLKPLGWNHIALADAQAPSTTVVTTGKTGQQAYNIKSVSLTFTAVDEGSGVERTEYSLNGGEWTSASGALLLSEDGDYTVKYRSVDKAGNIETFKTVQVRIDKLPPAISASGSVRFYQTDEELPLKIKAEDSVSGVKRVAYYIDAVPVAGVNQIAPVKLLPGKHVLTVWAWDQVGRAAKASFVLESEMDLEHLDELVDLGKSKKWIEGKSTVNKLQAKVTAVQKAPNNWVRAMKMNDLRYVILTQTGRTISVGFSAVMLADLSYIQKQAS